MLVEYYGGPPANQKPWEKIAKAPDKAKTDPMACVAAKWAPMNLHPRPLKQICLQTFYRENRYGYVLKDLISKVDDKKYCCSEKFIRL